MVHRRVFYPHQREMLAFLRQHLPSDPGPGGAGVALYVEQRLGKTLPTVRALRSRTLGHAWLIVAPYSAMHGWAETLAAEDVPYEVLTGTRMERKRRLLEAGPKVLLLNWQSVAPLVDTLIRIAWDAVIVDESRVISNPVSAVWRAVKQLQFAPYRVLLSGAPAPEGPQEYFTQILFCTPGVWGADPNYWEWRKRWFTESPEHPGRWYPTPEGERYIARTVAQHAYQLRRSDTPYALPATVDERRIAWADLPSDVRAAYTRVEREFIAQASDGTIEMTQWAGQRLVWLRRLASGLSTDAADASFWRHRRKLDLLLEVIAEYPDEPVIVWADYVAEIFAVAAELGRFPSRCAWAITGAVSPASREAALTAWCASGRGVLVAQPQTLARGQDLSAARVMVWWSLPQSLDVYTQAAERTRRIGVHASTHSVVLITEGTVDEDVWTALQTKDSAALSMYGLIEQSRRRRCETGAAQTWWRG